MRIINRVNSSVLPKPIGTSQHDLIVNVKHDRIAGGFDPLHRLGEQITRNSADDILSPRAAVCALAVAAVAEPAFSYCRRRRRAARARRQ